MDHILGTSSQKALSTARKQPWRPGNAAKQSKFSSQLFSHKDQGSDSFAMSMPSKTVQTWQVSLLTTRSCHEKLQYVWCVCLSWQYKCLFELWCYVLLNFSNSVLCHGHQQSIYILHVYLLRPYCVTYHCWSKKNFTLFYIYYWSKKKGRLHHALTSEIILIPCRHHTGGDGQWHSQEEVVQGDCHVEVLNPRGQTLANTGERVASWGCWLLSNLDNYKDIESLS